MSKISELSDGGSLVSSDYLIAVRSGGNVKVRMDQINVDQVDLGDNEFIRLGNSQDLTMVHTSTQSIINQAGIGDLLIQKAGTTKASITANGLEFPDNSKAIFGAGSDLQIYHDGSHARLREITGEFRIQTTSSGVNALVAKQNAEVEITYAGSTKLATTATGIDVTGTVTADGLTVGDTSASQSLIQMLANPTNGANTIHFGDGTSAAAYVGYINYAHDSNSMQFSAGGTERLRIDGATGNVGIGTSSLTGGNTILNLSRTGSGVGCNMQFANSHNGAFYVGLAGNTSGDAILHSADGTAGMAFGTNNTERMRIDASGNLLVNDTGVSGNAEKFRITSGGTSTATSAALFNNSAGTELFFVRSDGAFRTGTAAISPYNNTAAVTANLFVNTDGTLVRATSSRKYKKDIIDARFGLSDLLNLRPVNYKGINSEVDEDTIYGGLIAEEVHEAGLTEFVEYNKENQPDALRYQHMVSLCIKAIQEQQAAIEALTARIAALES